MKRALVIVDHGSRRREAHEHLERVAAEVQRLAPKLRVYVAHMDLADPSLGQALEACVRDGATDVVVHPFFLVPGRHLTDDVPALVDQAVRAHSGLRVQVSEPLGDAPGIAELVLQASIGSVEGSEGKA